MRALLLLSLVACALSQCTGDGDCGSSSALGATSFYKWQNGAFALDSVSQKCCKQENYQSPWSTGADTTAKYAGQCYQDRFQKCAKTDDEYGSQQVVRKYEKACGDNACNKYTETCISYSPANKDADYKIRQCVRKSIVGVAGMRIIGVPFLGLIMMLIGLGAILMVVKDAFGSFALGQKVVAALCVLMVAMGVTFLWFSYGTGASFALVIMVVAMITLLGLAAEDRTFKHFVVGVQIFAFLYIVGVWPAVLGSGIMSNVQPAAGGASQIGCSDWYMPSYFQEVRGYEGQYSGKNAAAASNEGYCSRGWITFENLIGFSLVIEISFTFVGYMMVTVGK